MAAAPTSALLAASNLGRKHPNTAGWLFQHVDFEVAAGDRLALVGPTGSGKSLILRALALLDPLDKGDIFWRGRPIADAEVPGYRAQVIYLQQRSPVLEGSVEDNLELPFTLRRRQGTPFPRAQLDELLANLGRDERFLSSRTKNLSGGERQIVALLRALLIAPTILLLDEPSAALDAQATSNLEGLVEDWQRQAPAERAFVWVSHDAEQAQRVADRVVQVSDGRIETGR